MQESLLECTQLLSGIQRSLKLSTMKEIDEIGVTCSHLQSTIELLQNEQPPRLEDGLGSPPAVEVCCGALLTTLKSFSRSVDAFTHGSSSVSALSPLFQKDLQLSAMNDQLKHLFLTTDPADTFSDRVAQDFWDVNFAGRAIVPVNDFVSVYCAAAESARISDESLGIIARYLDLAHMRYVSTYNFRVFLRSFGPLQGSARRLIDSVDSGVLAGNISAIEASSLLTGRPRGAYLVRFSKSRPGSFAVTFVDSKGGVKHCLLFASGPDKYGVTLRNPPEVFASLLDFVNAHRTRLSIPMAKLVKQRHTLDGSSSPGPYSRYLGKPGDADVEDDDSMCCICFDEPRDHLFLPCGHLAVGKRCADKMNVCCVCRGVVTSKVKVFHV